MKLEIKGVQITDEVIDALDKLQNQPHITAFHLESLDAITAFALLNFNSGDDEEAMTLLERLQSLQTVRSALVSLSMPMTVSE